MGNEISFDRGGQRVEPEKMRGEKNSENVCVVANQPATCLSLQLQMQCYFRTTHLVHYSPSLSFCLVGVGGGVMSP